MSSNAKNILKTTLILIIICTVTTAALAVTNAVTKDKITAINKQNNDKAMQEVLPAEKYDALTPKEADATYSIYAAFDSSDTRIGTVYITSSKGYGGNVSVITGIDTEGTIIRVKVTDVSNETPGLGQNAVKEAFTAQFTGKNEEIKVKDNIDALTGATITSKAVASAVNEALSLDKTYGGAQ